MRRAAGILFAAFVVIASGCATTAGLAPLDGAWDVTRINHVPTSGERFVLTFSRASSRASFEGYFGCNRVNGTYTLKRGRLRPGWTSMTQMGCPGRLQGHPVPVMTLEQWGFAVMHGIPRIVWINNGRVKLQSHRGEIELVRR